jgi:hypothetical protein
MKKIAILLLCCASLWGCIGGGTHGYIKAYRYGTIKKELEKAIGQTIAQNPAIIKDSVKGYYNDDTSYVTVHIVEKGESYSYIFRYYGGKEYWDTSKTSEIFIAYAYDTKGNGGSSGNGGVKWNDFKLTKELIGPFERVFIMKIDSMIGIKHIEE